MPDSPQQDQLRADVERGYTFEGPSFLLGTAMLDREPLQAVPVRMPLGTVNRHGLRSFAYSSSGIARISPP